MNGDFAPRELEGTGAIVTGSTGIIGKAIDLALADAGAGMVALADGTDDAARRLERVLWNDPASGVMRHADAGYDIAIECARENDLNLPMLGA